MIQAAILLFLFSNEGNPFKAGSLPLGTWTDVAGISHDLRAVGPKATVLFFMTVDCPIANRYSPEISRIARAYAPKKVNLYRVYVDPTVGNEAIIKHGVDFGFGFPALIDKEHRLVKLTKAAATPEVAVIDAKGILRYRGRIDDQYVEHGRPRTGKYRRDLRVALDQLLAGKVVSVPQTPAIGCEIPELD